MKKLDAKVLDASAGNRTMWITKDSPNILYIDIEEKLSYPPDAYIDTRETGFIGKQFHTIFFDPPHETGRTKNSTMFTTPDKKMHNRKWEKWARKGHPRYYGADKYKSHLELITYISESEREFRRILVDDGLLWLKWSENKYSLNEILECFKNWDIMLKIPVGYVGKSAYQTYWVCLMKKTEGLIQANL